MKHRANKAMDPTPGASLSRHAPAQVVVKLAR
jgi:hypothetical protein